MRSLNRSKEIIKEHILLNGLVCNLKSHYVIRNDYGMAARLGEIQQAIYDWGDEKPSYSWPEIVKNLYDGT